MPTASYFALAALLYAVTTWIVSRIIAEPLRADPVMGSYQIILCVLVFWSENKADPLVSRPAAAAGAALYTIGCAALTFFSNERLREILFYLGGPAIRISAAVREDWLGYHWTAARSFFSGEICVIDAAFAGTPNDYYQLFFYADNPLFPYAMAILGAMIVLAVLELGLLAQKNNSPLHSPLPKVSSGGGCGADSPGLFKHDRDVPELSGEFSVYRGGGAGFLYFPSAKDPCNPDS